ncbi:ATP-binding region, ATPase-like [Rhodopseudomonas palustris BisB5]|uniref:ATP-binding region, ATPase-like n=1 Tax=Rhodopseudomonas palustris (strain BisB5) TaxID=316057 RepID=Q133Z7_RHOPS|nr:ATP-binding region, ATPase-like [Rhodopseudomonas palustris BisB5]
MPFISYQETSLWKRAFLESRLDSNRDEQQYFQTQYLLLREKAAQLVSSINADIPGLTVHDVSHLDALWDMASIVGGNKTDLNPAEAFVLGGAILLHDAGLCLGAYRNRVNDLKSTTVWKDIVASAVQLNGSEPDEREIIAIVLRKLHAEKAAELPSQRFFLSKDETIFLIDEVELRRFYSRTIGLIAFSHWWPIERVEELSVSLGAFVPFTRCPVDRLKLACLLRVADAIHLDRRRAPLFRKALVSPQGVSADHWLFQEKIAAPRLEGDALVFTASEVFPRSEASSWWLAYDSIVYADKELVGANSLLREKLRGEFAARHIKGASSPQAFSEFVPVGHWRPIEAKIHASNVPKIVDSFGGSKLYGDDPLVAIRELIQNGRDAIDARRRRQGRDEGWGQIQVSTFERDGETWLSVEDNGVGMSERVLTGPFIDFGVSFWTSPLLHEEFPGLAASGVLPVGRFGVGFYSVFMLGDFVRVITRPCDQGIERSLVMEFREGLSSRPIIYSASFDEVPVDGGTRVEVALESLDLLFPSGAVPPQLETIVAAIAPAIDVNIKVADDLAVRASDWVDLKPSSLCDRYMAAMSSSARGSVPKGINCLMRPIYDANGSVVGRGAIYPSEEYSLSGVVAVGGMTASGVRNLTGILRGEAATVARNEASILIDSCSLDDWATEQAALIKRLKWDPETECRAAEIVMQCGGDVQGLVVARLGDQWISRRDVVKLLESTARLIVHFGDIYHEDEDGIPYSEFSRFRQRPDIITLPSYDGRIRPVRLQRSFEFGRSSSKCLLQEWFLRFLEKVWGESDKDDELEIVGEVHGVDVYRFVTKYHRRSGD